MAFTMPPDAPAVAQTREEQRSARRDAILAAARKVFAQSGYEGATIADIAREAGVASGTVYLYYESKTDLFAELATTLFQSINNAMRSSQTPPDLVGGTRARIHTIFAYCSEHRDLVRLIFLNPDPRTELSRRYKRADEQRVRPLTELFSAGMEAGAIRRADARLLANVVSGLVISALYQCFVLSDGGKMAAYEDAVVDMIVGALQPR
jgi:AcrR family transcriptional regulator